MAPALRLSILVLVSVLVNAAAVDHKLDRKDGRLTAPHENHRLVFTESRENKEVSAVAETFPGLLSGGSSSLRFPSARSRRSQQEWRRVLKSKHQDDRDLAGPSWSISPDAMKLYPLSAATWPSSSPGKHGSFKKQQGGLLCSAHECQQATPKGPSQHSCVRV